MTSVWDAPESLETIDLSEIKPYKDELQLEGPAGPITVPIEAPRPSTDNRIYTGTRVTWKLYRPYSGTGQTHATQVTEENLDHIKHDWMPSAPVRVGDYVLLQGDGRVMVVDETSFGDTYFVASPK